MGKCSKFGHYFTMALLERLLVEVDNHRAEDRAVQEGIGTVAGPILRGSATRGSCSQGLTLDVLSHCT
jgi:hypothetical protein